MPIAQPYGRALAAAKARKPAKSTRKPAGIGGKPALTGRALALTRGQGKKIGLKRITSTTPAPSRTTRPPSYGFTPEGETRMPKPLGGTEADGGFRTFPKTPPSLEADAGFRTFKNLGSSTPPTNGFVASVGTKKPTITRATVGRR